MPIDNPNDEEVNFLLSLCLGICTALSRIFHFSISQVFFKLSNFSLSILLATILDIPVADAAHYIDLGFHYTLGTITILFTSVKFYDYMKQRKKTTK